MTGSAAEEVIGKRCHVSFKGLRPREIDQVLRETQLEPGSLDLEITKNVLIKDVRSSAATLYWLKRLGMRLTIDDFEPGYLSLSYLRRLPLDFLRSIARSSRGLGRILKTKERLRGNFLR